MECALSTAVPNVGNVKWFAHYIVGAPQPISIALVVYSAWFYSLVVEKPFLTFGMARDVLIAMAGVAELAMGFGSVDAAFGH